MAEINPYDKYLQPEALMPTVEAGGDNPYAKYLAPEDGSVSSAPTAAAPPPLYPTPQSAQAVNTGFENEMLAASQRTTPNLSAHAPNLVSSDLLVNDNGELMYRDPETKEVHPAEDNKHIYLRDPADNQLKLFKRTPKTDEGRAASMGRILLPAVTGSKLPIVGTVQEAVAAGRELGVDLPRAATSGAVGIQRLGKISAGMPGGAPLIRKSQEALGQLEDVVNNATKTAGGETDLAKVGESVQKGINTDFKDKVFSVLNKLYGNVDNLVNPDIKSSLPRTLTAANDIAAQRGAAALSPESPALKAVMEGVTRPEGMTYQGIKDLRTNIGDLMKEESIAGRPTEGLNQVYGALSDDLRTAAGRAGGRGAVAAFDTANAASHFTKQMEESLGKIIGPDSRSAEGVTGAIRRMAGVGPSADINTLELAHKALPPEAWRNVSSSVINQLGRDKSGVFSPTRFVSDYAQISPRAKELLFGDELRKTLDQVNTISNQNFKRLDQFANTSRTAGHGAAGALGLGAAVEGISALAHGSPREAAAAVGAATGGVLANNLLARYLASSPKAVTMAPSAAIARPALKLSDILATPQGDQPPALSNLAHAISGSKALMPTPISYPALPLSR